MAKEENDLEVETISPVEFMKRGYIHWLEAHWSFCGSVEDARDWFKSKGFDGKIFAMTYDNDNTDNPSIFGWWMEVEE